MRTIPYRITLLVLATIWPECARAVPADTSADQAVATEHSVRFIHRDSQEHDYLSWTMIIGEVFGVPISFEWSGIHEDRSDKKIPTISFTIEKGQSLAQVLDNFCGATKGQMQWGRIQGVIFVWPTEKQGIVESLLEVPVSLHLNSASTWEAFLALSKAINANAPADRYVRPSPNPIQDERLPPLALREAKTITLDLKDLSAREAACAIMAASPLRMSIWYSNSYRPGRPPKAEISIWAFDENHGVLSHIPQPPSREEELQWYTEAKSVVPAGKDSAEPVLKP